MSCVIVRTMPVTIEGCRGILWIVPKGRQHGVRAFVECDQIRSRELVGEIVLQAGFNGFPDVLPDGLVALGRGDVNTSPCFTRNVNTEPRPTLVCDRHWNPTPQARSAHIRKCVNATGRTAKRNYA
jgi:hypothetical protein